MRRCGRCGGSQRRVPLASGWCSCEPGPGQCGARGCVSRESRPARGAQALGRSARARAPTRVNPVRSRQGRFARRGPGRVGNQILSIRSPTRRVEGCSQCPGLLVRSGSHLFPPPGGGSGGRPNGGDLAGAAGTRPSRRRSAGTRRPDAPGAGGAQCGDERRTYVRLILRTGTSSPATERTLAGGVAAVRLGPIAPEEAVR